MTEDEILAAALRITDPAERSLFIERSCGGDAALAARIATLLMAAADEATGLMEPAAEGPAGRASSKRPAFTDPLIGQSIGGVKLVRMISEGGMGRVYEGRQENPRRTVAVKLVKPGVASEKLLRRFEFEAQVLARLRHPGIAQIHAAGTFGEGAGAQPYFVMEYIAGAKPLTQYAADLKLSTHDRLALFRKVCDAVAHGHQNGVIHRDLKPSNILVDSTGQPKVIDFGVAKTTDSDMALTTLQTDVGQLIGTYQYMSPEQFEADPHGIDIRSDVYALGVVLYELLAGQPPYDLKRKLPHEISSIVRQHDPTPVTTVNKTLRRDVGVIAGKCLEKDRNRRYSSASELAGDIGRYLSGDPITAVAPSFWDGVVRLARRHKVAATAVAGVAASLVAAVVGISVFAVRAEQAKREADVQREEATAQRDAAEQARVAEAEQRGLAEQQKVVAEENEKIARTQALLALETIQFVLKDVDGKLRQLPRTSDVRLAVLDTLSTKMSELDTKLTGGVRGDSLVTLMAIRQKAAVIYQELGRLDEANREFERLYAMSAEDMVNRTRCDATRLNRAKVAFAWESTRPPNGVALLEEAVALARECLADPQSPPDGISRQEIEGVLSAALQNLAVRHLYKGRLPEAATHFEESIRIVASHVDQMPGTPGFSALSEDERAARLKDPLTSVFKMAIGLAYVYLRMGRAAEALPIYDSVIARCRESLDRAATEHVQLHWKVELAAYLGNYGQSLVWIGEYGRADAVLRESLDLWEAVHAADPEKVGHSRELSTALYRLAALRDLEGDAEGARSLQERCRAIRQELADATPDARNLGRLMLIAARCGRSDEVRSLIGRVRDDEADADIDNARALAQLSRHVPEADRPAMIAEALTALEQAVDGGFSDPFRIKAEPDLAPLRGEARFAAVVARLEAGR